jgi:ArsR family transcriptional regulator, cadmium/lead-responsive transcriptional repressor
MCGDEPQPCCSQNNSKFQEYFRVLHCPTRWIIIRLIGDSTKSTNEIFEGLQKTREGISKSGLYYHLSEMEKAEIIELAEYREVGGGAPEKVWKLKTKEIKINLLTDLPKVPNNEH